MSFLVRLSVLALFLLPSISFGATGFAYQGDCYASLADIQQVINNEGSKWDEQTSQPISVSYTALGSNFVQVQYFNSSGAVFGTFNIYPPSCSSFSPISYSSASLSNSSLSEILLISACALCCFIGIRSGMAI